MIPILVWNVLVEDFNRKEIIEFNVFQHYRFLEDCKKIIKECGDNKEMFAKELDHEVRYYYWCKTEWEIICTAWPPYKKFNDRKVDVYTQLHLNWDTFVDYIWSNNGAI